MIRVQLPYHLQTLARVGREVELQIEGVATLSSVMDALETQYPMLRGTVRDYTTGQRPFHCLDSDGLYDSPDPAMAAKPGGTAETLSQVFRGQPRCTYQIQQGEKR